MTVRRRRPRESGADPSYAIVTRLRLAAAAAAFAALAVYASIIPFDTTVLSPGTAWTLIMSSWPPTVTSKTDFAANVLLQFPLGFLLTGAMALKPSRSRSLAVVASTVAGASLALGIEWAQGMVADRTPSLTDVFAETVGALAGALVWIRSGPRLAAFVNATWRSRGSRALVPLAVYALVWILGRWSPFDFTLRLPELAQKFRSGLLVLWPGAPGAEGLAATVGSTAGQWLLAVPLGVAARIGHAAGPPRLSNERRGPHRGPVRRRGGIGPNPCHVARCRPGRCRSGGTRRGGWRLVGSAAGKRPWSRHWRFGPRDSFLARVVAVSLYAGGTGSGPIAIRRLPFDRSVPDAA